MYFSSLGILKKRITLFAVICLAYGGGVWGYHAYTQAQPYYQPYYLKSHLFAVGKIFNNTATAAVTAFKSKPTAYESGAETRSEAFAESIPVLVYHGILKESDGTNLDLSTFIDQMTTLKNAGYETVSLNDFYQFLHEGKDLPQKSFLLTFDDGRKDSYYPADPILRALNYTAVMFAIGKFSLLDSSSYYLTRNEISRMEKSGRWEIESHTNSHRDLATLPQDELESEISGSKETLEMITGRSITAFAFPFGEFGQESSYAAQQFIMDIAQRVYLMGFFQFFTPIRFTQNYSDPSPDGHYLVKRINVLATWSGKDLLSVLQKGEVKTLPFEAQLTPDDGWINTLWGEMAFKDGRLSVQANETGTGSAIILDGSRKWRDYRFDADLLWHGGSNLYLWARYKNDENYIACNFGNSLAHIEETVGGVTSVIQGNNVRNKEFIEQNNFTASIHVNGRNVECLLNGEVLVRTEFLDEQLLEGGVGVKVWDSEIGNGAIEITRAVVDPLVTSSSSMSPTKIQ